MNCKYCGTYNQDDFIYCLNCGKKLNQKGVKETFKTLITRNKKTLIIAVVVLLVLLGGLFGIKSISNKNESYYFNNSKTIVVDENGNCYIYEGNVRKAEINNATLNGQTISFDQSARLLDVEADELKSLYIYRDGKLNKITDSYDKYLISDNGEKVFYTDDENGEMYLYDVKSKKSTAVLSEGEEKIKLGNYVLSSTGNYLAYTFKDQKEDLIYLYSSKGTEPIPTEETMSGLVGVSDQGQIIYTTSDKAVHVCDKGGDIVIVDQYDSMYVNKDYTQLALRYENDFYIYKNKKTSLVLEKDDIKITDVITPQNTIKRSISQTNNGKIRETATHIAIDNFEEKYYKSSSYDILTIHKNNIAETVVEKASVFILSKDGKELYYKGEYGNIVCYSNGNNKDYYNGHAEVKKIHAHDHVNKGLYFSLEDDNLCYSNGKNTSLVSGQDPVYTLLCDDGYFYYVNDSVLYAVNKGQNQVLIDEIYDIGEGVDKYGTNSDEGVFYQKGNNIFFASKGKASQLNISD